MAKIKKSFWLEEREAKQVEKAAKRLKVSESQVIRWQLKALGADLWFKAVKNQDET